MKVEETTGPTHLTVSADTIRLPLTYTGLVGVCVGGKQIISLKDQMVTFLDFVDHEVSTI